MVDRPPDVPHERADSLLEAQAGVLALVAGGRPLREVLEALCRIVETHAHRPVRAAILLVDGDGKSGSLAHPPLAVGLQAAWSMPITASTGDVLGTFGTYLLEPGEPTAGERRLVEVLARTAALAIERQRSEDALRASARRDRFLANLAAETQRLSDPSAVMRQTAQMLAEHLDVDRCAYAEVEDERVFVITGDHARGVPSIVGRWPVDAFGPECARSMLAAEPFVVADAELEITAEHRAAYHATNIRAVICVPLHKHDRFTAAMAVHQTTPRAWTADEVELVREVVARCWETIERTRIAHESEQRHRALAESAARWGYAVQLSGVGFWYCDLPFADLQWDERVKEHFFLPPDAHVTIELFYERIHPDDRAPTRQAIDASVRDQSVYDVVYRTVDPASGTTKWIRALGGSVRAEDGTPVRFDGVTVDVTAQKLAEVRLKQVADAALTIHAASSLDSLLNVITEEARRIIGAHQAVTSLTTGADWAQSINAVSMSDKYRAFRSYDASSTGKGIYANVCRTNRPMRLTQAELEAHPAWRRFSDEENRHPPMRGWLAAPFVGRDGSNLGLIQLSDRRDGEFTEADEAILVQLAQIAAVAIENARLYERLRDQDRRKDEFIATLAHELRNPLAPIRTGLHILQITRDPAQADKTRAVMERQLGHLVRMVDDLLDISRITLGKVTLAKQRVDASAVVHSALETTKPLVDAAGHTVLVELPNEPLPLDADPTRIAQVVANLVNNAAKYTPAGGRIVVSARREGRHVVIEVSDNGLGIPEDMVARVFDMFTQVSPSAQRSQSGLGLGLTLVRRLVELHGGDVVAQSAGPGRGSTFRVRLPLATGHAASAERSTGDTASMDVPTMRVLVVDDNVDGAESLATLLTLKGHDARVAHNGVAALSLATQFQPQLVFLDIGLPGLSGYDVARRLRAEPGAQPVIVALTGWGTDEDRRQAKVAGFDHHLVKPVDASKVDDVLATVDP